MKKYLILLAFMMGPMVASAGIIAPDGNEWELRGSFTDVAGHTVEAASDTGWMWASLADWTASGLDNLKIFGADVDAFEGVCDGTGLFCDSYLSTTTNSGFQITLFCRCAEGRILVDDRWKWSGSSQTSSRTRVSFRAPPSAVPEPTSVALLGLSLLGLGLARRRVKR